MDDFIVNQMRERQIIGLSLAVAKGGEIIARKSYGFADASGKFPITTDTVFQAGSISKSIAALGALRLVESGRLSLDADINASLRSWKVPKNQNTEGKQITLRQILSHRAGFTLHGFAGYPIEQPLPKLLQILDGIKPANSPAIRVNVPPDSMTIYSGGGYVVLQQIITDVISKSFPEFMRDVLFEPLGMINSTFEQPLFSEKTRLAAAGHLQNDKMIAGHWHVYPELAAAGLWTTASDLMRFGIAVHKSFSGATNLPISPAMTRLMLERQADSHFGLGVKLEGKDKSFRFYHTGRNKGFDAVFIFFAKTGNGVAILMNKNDDTGMLGEILKATNQEHQLW